MFWNGEKRFYKQLLEINRQSKVIYLISDLSLAKE